MSGMLRSILSHPSGRIGGLIVLAYLAIALLAALGLTPHDPLAQHRLERLHAPSLSYWMGTDLFGRDVASRLMKGVGQSFTVASSRSRRRRSPAPCSASPPPGSAAVPIPS